MDPESPLQRLRRLEAEERAARAGRARPGEEAGERAPARRRGLVASIVASLALVLSKAKLLLGALKFGSLLQTFSTLALSAWVYSGYFGPSLAICIVLLILVHEYGHGIAARIMGLRVGAPIFIPFFGAVIALKDQPRTTWIDAVVGYGGPAAGTLGGLVALSVGLALGDTHWGGLLVVTAWITFTINLFNLLPVFGLDGDRISQPFEPWYWIPGCALVLTLGLLSVHWNGHFQPFLLLILLLGAIKGSRLALKLRRERLGGVRKSALEQITERPRYVEEASVRPWQRSASAWAYFALVAGLSALVLWSRHLAPVVEGAAGR